MGDLITQGLGLTFPVYAGSPDSFASTVLNGGAEPEELQVMAAYLAAEGSVELAEVIAGIARQKRAGIDLLVRPDFRLSVQGMVQRDAARLSAALSRISVNLGGLAGVRREEATRRLLEHIRSNTPGTGVVQTDQTVSIEERLAGAGWRATILPLALKDLSGGVESEGTYPFEWVVEALRDPDNSDAVRILALRLLGDHIRDMSHPETFLKTITAIAAICGDLHEPKLKEMALALLHEFQNPRTTRSSFRFESFFEQIQTALERRGHSQRPSFPGRRIPLFEGEVQRYGREILALRPEILRLLRQSLPDPSHFFLPEERSSRGEWNSNIPAWYVILPGLLGIKGEREALAKEARGVFSDKAKPVWRRGLALALYSYLFTPDKKLTLSKKEADAACNSLLQILTNSPESDVLYQMAVAIFPRVVVNQIRAAEGKSAREVARVREWALMRADQLRHVSETLGGIKAEKIRKVVQARLAERHPVRWLDQLKIILRRRSR